MAMTIDRRFVLLFIIVFIDSLGVGIILPILPHFAERFNADTATISLLFGIFSLGQVVALPILGHLSDGYGRRAILFVSLVGTAVGYFLAGIATTIGLVFVGRLIAGFTGGNQSIAQAYVSDITSEKDRISGMGLFGSAVVLGLIVGPVLGGVFAQGGDVQRVFLGLAALSLLNAFGTLLFLSESEIRKPQPFMAGVRRDIMLSPWRNKILLLVGISFIINLGFSLIYGTIPFFTKEKFDFSDTTLGWYLAFLALVAALSQILAAAFLYRNLGDRRMIVLSCIILGASLAILGVVTQHRFAFIDSIFVAISLGLINPTIYTSLSLIAKAEGMAFGIFQSGTVLAIGIGSSMGGFFFSFTPALPYVIGGIMILITGILVRAKKRAWEAYEAGMQHTI